MNNNPSQKMQHTPAPQKTPLLPKLIKGQSTYNLIVPQSVEEKIRYLIRKYPHTEWSGILFYTFTGSFESNNLTITCQDIYPMDLGTAGWTEFHMSEDVASYMAENLELFNCEMGLVHSHHTMGAFLSGQDIKMLSQEGNDTNCFVSLVVDTKGTYVAAITRKLQHRYRITKQDLGTSYELFGSGSIQLKDPESITTTTEKSTDTIEYFDLKVERHPVDNPLSYLDTRFDEILSKKQPSSVKTFNEWQNIKEREFRQPSFFDNPNFNPSNPSNPFNNPTHTPASTPVSGSSLPDIDDPSSWTPSPDAVNKAVAQILTCSFIIDPKKFDLKQWITRNMERVYDKQFLSSDSRKFQEWCEFIIQFTFDYFEDPLSPDYDLMVDNYQAILAQSIYDILFEHIDTNPYVRQYCKYLELYMQDL